MKYGTWKVGSCDLAQAQALCSAGFSPLTARVLASRGCRTPEQARVYLCSTVPLPDPLQLRDMERAAGRVRQAIRRGEHIAVFGDYDVDGITATCLLTDFLRREGACCTPYIPGRIEEGYGLNEAAIRYLAELGVRLIITVDCGITALDEAALCRALGVELIVTDHHECKEELPDACAVIDPHRPDRTYPHTGLCGVGIAFKLASAISGNQAEMLEKYCDLLCLGTIADVMPLQGENRTFVVHGLKALQKPLRPGIAALIRECGCDRQEITSNTVGYILAPRINAAGRMGQVETAVELFLTEDAGKAAQAAAALCQLNRDRQSVELGIYEEAVSMLSGLSAPPKAIVLASEHWHQGVVGIVASRLAEDWGCPAFLICLDGAHGKASSRSYGGFNLFASLTELSDLLESYGGHELAAGFTIARDRIDRFRTEITKRAAAFLDSGAARNALECDCAVSADLLTPENVTGLEELEPCGSGCPHPVFCMEHLRVESLSEVGGGRHLRLRLRAPSGELLNAIFFSTTTLRAAVSVGDCVDVAFTPQMNDYRGFCTVQLNLTDIRPSEDVRAAFDREGILYRKLRRHMQLSHTEAAQLLPVRQEFVAVWRYLVSQNVDGAVYDEPCCLSRKIARYGHVPVSFVRTRICLDVFAEQGLILLDEQQQGLRITICGQNKKVDLASSAILRSLTTQKGGGLYGDL